MEPVPFDPLNYENIARSVVGALLGRPIVDMVDMESFEGVGIYALYYMGEFPLYAPLKQLTEPIYVGKAIPPGSRTGDAIHPKPGRKLYNRLNEHRRSIEDARNLQVNSFRCRYLIVKHVWIPLAEQVLIRRFKPLWNAVVDGFGNHDPGAGRRNMARPDWDILHPGRDWARLLDQKIPRQTIAAAVEKHFRERLSNFADHDG